MRISRRIFQRMVDHARKEWPVECCGLLAGADGFAKRIYPLKNQDVSRTSYLAVPEEQIQAMRAIEDLGLDVLAVYHSHPDTGSYPSAVDLEKAYFTGAVYVIISLKDPEPEVRGFWIGRDGEVTEERIHVS